eukprot:gene26275-32830_t
MIELGCSQFTGAELNHSPVTSHHFNTPFGLWGNSADEIFVADKHNNRVVQISNGFVHYIAGFTSGASGGGYLKGDHVQATSTKLYWPSDVFGDSTNDYLYFTDSSNNRVRDVNFKTGISTVIGGNGGVAGSEDFKRTGTDVATSSALNNPTGMHGDLKGNIYIVGSNADDAPFTGALISTVAGQGGTGMYRKPDGSVATPPGVITATTQATSIRLNMPHDVWVDSAGEVLFIADQDANDIKRVDLKSGVISVYFGGTNGGVANTITPSAKPSLRSFTFHPIATPSEVPTEHPASHKSKKSSSVIGWTIAVFVLLIVLIVAGERYYRHYKENTPYTVSFAPSAPLLMELIKFEAVATQEGSVSYLGAQSDLTLFAVALSNQFESKLLIQSSGTLIAHSTCDESFLTPSLSSFFKYSFNHTSSETFASVFW